MSDSGSASSSSWTILTPEETVAETLRPVAEGAGPHEEPLNEPSTAEPAGRAAESGVGAGPVFTEEGQSVESQQAPQEMEPERNEDTIPHMEASTSDPAHDLSLAPDLNPISVSDTPPPSSSEVLSPEPTHDISPTPDLNTTSVTDDHPPSSLEVPAPSRPDPDTLSQSAGLSESLAPLSPDPDLFSDSYTHISPSVEELPGSPLTTETLAAEGLTPEEEGLIQEGETIHQLNGEGHGLEEESELRVTDVGRQTDFPLDSEVGEERAEEQGESGLRRRRASLQAALEQIGRSDEDEEEDEEEVQEFRLPQTEEESGFSLNKCILGAVILLGLGTIFFSGVFMDLDEEGEYDARELRDAEATGKQEWLNPEIPSEIPPIDVDNTDLLNKPSLENQQITLLQAQLQAQKEELKVAQGHAAEGAKERLRREEVEKENGRLKKEMTSLAVLQKENERMKRELASVPALQREVERLRATVTELKLTTAKEVDPPPPDSTTIPPPSGLVQEGSQKTDSTIEEAEKPQEEEKMEKDWTGGKEWKKEKSEQGERVKGWKDKGEKREWKAEKEWREGGKREQKAEKERKEGGKKEWKAEKEWKGGKRDQEKEGKEWKQKEEKKEWKGKEDKRGEWKKEKASRGDEGKPWKDREEKKEWKEKSERKEWKKGKHDRWNEAEEWKGKGDTKEKKGGKEYEWKGGKDEWRGEKEWRKGKDGTSKGWKEKGERKEWHSDKDFKKKDGKKDSGKEERKPWQGKDKEWSKDGERKEWKERKDGDWKRDKGSHYKSKDGHKQDSQEKSNHQHYAYREKEKKERVWHGPGEKSPAHSHRRPPLEQPDYWTKQRARLQHDPRPPAQCTSVETCAQAEGLRPVPLPEFEALLLGYLAKAEVVGVEASKREELSKLAKEFFRDGVFAHDQMSFQDFVEDVENILEDMVEKEVEDDDESDGDESDDEAEEQQGIEEEMDEFEKEAMKKFALPGGGEKAQRKKGEWKKESGRSRG